MEDIQLKKSYLKVDQPSYISSLICLLVGSIQIVLTRIWAIDASAHFALLTIAIVLISFAIYSITTSIKNSPSVLFNDDILLIGSNAYYWTDFKKASFTGKKPCKCIFRYSMEGMMLQFGNEKPVYLLDYVYSDLWKLKLFVQQIVIEQKKKMEFLQPESPQDDSIYSRKIFYKGDCFFSAYSILYWGTVAILIILSLEFCHIYYLSDCTLAGTILLICITAILMLLFWAISCTMHFFELSDNYITAKNHILFWKKETYSLQNIREVGFDKGFINNRRFSLKLITKDFKYSIYPAGTLSQKQWKDLGENLKKHGVKVRYE
ncbi:hypothetical protein FQ707_10090 [Bacteroidaceae bacterium HV4-6-C5C]|nr:hypothetical protein FQ707_10090 [Bacteroidaceae bacterium HV4-6-C5C]